MHNAYSPSVFSAFPSVCSRCAIFPANIYSNVIFKHLFVLEFVAMVNCFINLVYFASISYFFQIFIFIQYVYVFYLGDITSLIPSTSWLCFVYLFKMYFVWCSTNVFLKNLFFEHLLVCDLCDYYCLVHGSHFFNPCFTQGSVACYFCQDPVVFQRMISLDTASLWYLYFYE